MIFRHPLASFKGASFRCLVFSSVQVQPGKFATAGTEASNTTASTGPAAQEAAMQLLFLVVALLLIADLHSSFVAGPSKWESNPVVAAMAEHMSLPVALAITKLLDGLGLCVLYAIWCRTAAHLVTVTVLGIVALHYLPIVLENYLR